MPRSVAVLMDPISTIKVVKDTTFAMLLEAQRRGHNLLYVTQSGLAILCEDWLIVTQAEYPGNQFRLLRMILHDQGRSHRPFPRTPSGSIRIAT